MEITPVKVRDGGGGAAGGVDIRLPPPEHSCIIYCNREIMDLCLSAERRPGTWVSRRGWYHDGLDVEGMQTVDQATEWTKGDEDTDGTRTAT